MEVDLFVPLGTDLSVVRTAYPDLIEDDSAHVDDEHVQCWIGQSMEDDEDESFEWMTHDGAVDFCGFCEGAIEGAETIIEGNGGWAQSMLRRRDFSSLCSGAELKQYYKEVSDRYWAAHARGQSAAAAVPATE